MNVHPRPLPTTSAAIAVLLLVLAGQGCSKDSPLSLEKDPLVGQWSGTFLRITGTQSADGEMEVVVRAGGDAVATGMSFYEFETDTLIEQIFIDFLVGPDGEAVGEATYLLYVVGNFAGYLEGPAEAQFDAVTGDATGTVTLDLGDGTIFPLTFTVTKVVEP